MRKRDKLTDPRSRQAVEVAERFADGEATGHERTLANREAAVVWEATGTDTAWMAAMAASSRLGDLAANMPGVAARCGVPPAAQAALLRDVFGNPFRPWRKPLECDLPEDGTCRAHGKRLTRTGPDTRMCPDGAGYQARQLQTWLAWSDGAVRKMAQAIYDERDFGRVPLLADALEEAGCTDEVILRHCRGYDPFQGPLEAPGWSKRVGPHVRGCWVVDLILGKE